MMMNWCNILHLFQYYLSYEDNAGVLTLKAPITTIVVCLVLPVTLKVISANSVDPDQTAPLGAV